MQRNPYYLLILKDMHYMLLLLILPMHFLVFNMHKVLFAKKKSDLQAMQNLLQCTECNLLIYLSKLTYCTFFKIIKQLHLGLISNTFRPFFASN